jgi:hypothetical protein
MKITPSKTQPNTGAGGLRDPSQDRHTDGTGLGDPFRSCGNVDAVAHEVTVALLDHIAEMDADAELDATSASI